MVFFWKKPHLFSLVENTYTFVPNFACSQFIGDKSSLKAGIYATVTNAIGTQKVFLLIENMIKAHNSVGHEKI